MPSPDTKATPLYELYRALSRSTPGWRTRGYRIPALWQRQTGIRGPLEVDPLAFYTGVIGSILDRAPAPDAGGRGWSSGSVVYNMMVRLTCAYDHDGDGGIVPLNADGWRETGSFLKAIALLPYVASLGADTIHLMPVQEIGADGRRGSLGSPYAVRNPVEFDPMLGEPQTGMSVRSQFAAFVEAAHHLGLRIVVELPLRTMSKDSVWVKDHPEWFYWIGAAERFHPPSFTREEVTVAQEKVSRGDYDALPEPPGSYRAIFSAPPDPSTIRMEEGRWVGTSPDGRPVVIPGAFADWPPDDHQPVWNDITYLKFHQDTRFNYPSYNTVRMYDSSLLSGGTETESLWRELAETVAGYVREFGIDGMMIDMAHALPEPLTREIVRKTREINPDFSFWAEDFTRTAAQAEAGYDAVLGGQWACQHRPGDFRDMLSWISRTPGLPPHLAAPETHNTPRAVTRRGGEIYSRHAWTVSCFIPAIPFIHSGFELYERRPVNTGLAFTPEELASFPAAELPLFSAHALGWDRSDSAPEWIRNPLRIRTEFRECVVAGRGSEFRIIQGGHPGILAFIRSDPGRTRHLAVVANSDMEKSVDFAISGIPGGVIPSDLLSGEVFAPDSDGIRGSLGPGGVVVFGSRGRGG